MSNEIIVAIIGGAAGIIGALSVLVDKIYNIVKERRGNTLEKRVATVVEPIISDAVKPIITKQDMIQRDVTRMRLLDLIRHEPHDAENILMVGKIYFGDFKGNSEASKQFARWLKNENIKRPEWFTWQGKQS